MWHGVQEAFDANGDGIVTWEEALSTFTRKIGEMKSDRRDMWVRHNRMICIPTEEF